MGQRGRNRNGFYIALLHVLELQYKRESELGCCDPGQWQPSPQSRPDQFLRWVLDVLSMLSFPQPRAFADVLDQLKSLGLAHVARLLDHAVQRMVARRRESGAIDIYSAAPEALLDWHGSPTRAPERHPQVRKFSKVVARELDEVWRAALVATANEFLGIEGLRPSALVLGGLPPSFPVLNDIILARLSDGELIADHEALTVLQLYGLVAGCLPEAPTEWKPAFSELEKLKPEQLRLIGSLTHEQVRQLRTIRDGAWRLLKARRRLRMSGGQWIEFGRRLDLGTEAVRRRAVERLRGALPAEFSREVSDRELLALGASTTWQQVADIDEEMARLLIRGDVGRRLLRRLQAWDDATWSAARRILHHDGDRCIAYIEDSQVLQRLFLTRTFARLSLRDLFPRSLEWLDQFLRQNLEDSLMHDVAEVQLTATIVSRRIQQQFWSSLPLQAGRVADRTPKSEGDRVFTPSPS